MLLNRIRPLIDLRPKSCHGFRHGGQPSHIF